MAAEARKDGPANGGAARQGKPAPAGAAKAGERAQRPGAASADRLRSRAPASAIPDSGVHEAGRYRTSAPAGQGLKPLPVRKDVHTQGPDRVSFGFDPAVARAPRMHAKPTKGHRSVVGVLQGNQSQAISVQQFRCAMVRNRNADCMRCAQACTSGCIHLVDGQLFVSADKCVGCGTCATVCPTCALEAHNPTDTQLLESCLAHAVPVQGAEDVGDASGSHSPSASAQTPQRQCVIVCQPLAQALEGLLDPNATTPVVCLGRVDESLVVRLVAKRVSQVALVSGVCEQCEQKLGVECARTVAENATTLLAAWGSNANVRVTDHVPACMLAKGVAPQQAQQRVHQHFLQVRANPPLQEGQAPCLQDTPSQLTASDHSPAASQALASNDSEPSQPAPAGCSSAFPLPSSVSNGSWSAPATNGGLSSHSASARDVIRVMRDGTLPHYLPRRRELLLEALDSIGTPQTDAIATRLWGRVSIDAAICTSCRMCATFCPTGAIAKYGQQDSDDFGVEHYPGDCVKCGTCQAICPQDAIQILDEVRPIELVEGTVRTFAMLPRAVTLNNEHQVVNTLRSFIEGDIFER